MPLDTRANACALGAHTRAEEHEEQHGRQFLAQDTSVNALNSQRPAVQTANVFKVSRGQDIPQGRPEGFVWFEYQAIAPKHGSEITVLVTGRNIKTRRKLTLQ